MVLLRGPLCILQVVGRVVKLLRDTSSASSFAITTSNAHALVVWLHTKASRSVVYVQLARVMKYVIGLRVDWIGWKGLTCFRSSTCWLRTSCNKASRLSRSANVCSLSSSHSATRESLSSMRMAESAAMARKLALSRGGKVGSRVETRSVDEREDKTGWCAADITRNLGTEEMQAASSAENARGACSCR